MTNHLTAYSRYPTTYDDSFVQLVPNYFIILCKLNYSAHIRLADGMYGNTAEHSWSKSPVFRWRAGRLPMVCTIGLWYWFQTNAELPLSILPVPAKTPGETHPGVLSPA